MGSRRLRSVAARMIVAAAVVWALNPSVAATPSTTPHNSHSDDTRRIDPLDGFKKYRGGFDITNKHYWSSAVFTGVYGYAIGALWLLCGVSYGWILLVASCCNKTSKDRKLKERSPWPLLLATCFTILAVTACGVVLGGSARFHSRATTVLNIIMDTADEASETLYNTTGAMKDIRDNLQASNQQAEVSAFLTSTTRGLNFEASNIQKQARKNRRLINTGLKIVYITTTATISLLLIAAIALSAFGFLRLQPLLNWLTLICWLLTAFCWFSFGAYFFLERFVDDTCTALNNFKENPYNNTLSSILPCDQLLSARPVLSDVSAAVYNLVNQVNADIAVQQAALPVQVCNPFSGPPDYRYQSGYCPENTVRINDIPQALEMLTCSDSKNRACGRGEFITVSDFRTVKAYTTSLQELLNGYPAMESLIECRFVKDAFSEILREHCKPLKRYDRMVWISMVSLSSIMVVLVLIWAAKAHPKRRRRFFRFSDCSATPDLRTKI